jgi:NADH-ubiquinone oxidoreductase chain 1
LWTIYPHTFPSIIILFSALYFLCVSRLNVYTTFIAGWCSNSKYALLGSLRRIAQTISYEVSISLILLSCLLIHHSININFININIISWISIIILPVAILWFITNLAETNRTPFDLAEGESELVSGFNTEYRRSRFALIFIAEYANILVIRLFTVTFFIGTYISSIILILFTVLIALLFVWLRATLPRIRYDNLIYLTWKCFLPFTLTILYIIPSLIII